MLMVRENDLDAKVKMQTFVVMILQCSESHHLQH